MKKSLLLISVIACCSSAAIAQTSDPAKVERARQNRESVRKMFPIVGMFDKKSNATATQSASSSANVAAATPAQTAQIDSLLAAKMQDARIAADVREASPLIKTIATTGACAKNSAAWNPLSRQMLEPKSYGAGFGDILYTPRAFFKYHEDASCLDVVRLTNWSKPANNALAFTAFYVSPQSGEAISQNYTLQKSTTDGWLIQKISNRQS